MFSRESRVLNTLKFATGMHPNGCSGYRIPPQPWSTEGSSPSVPLVDLRPNGAPVRYYAVEDALKEAGLKHVGIMKMKMKWNIWETFFGMPGCLCCVVLDIGDYWWIGWWKCWGFVGCCVVVGSYCLFFRFLHDRPQKIQGCRCVPYTCSETTPKMVPYMDLNIGFQALALLDSRPSLCEWEENGWNFQRLWSLFWTPAQQAEAAAGGDVFFPRNLESFIIHALTVWWFQIFLIFTPIWGRFPFGSILTNIFQVGWNHQLVDVSWDVVFAMFFMWPKTLHFFRLGGVPNWTREHPKWMIMFPNDDCRVVAFFMLYLHRKRVLLRCKPFSTISLLFFSQVFGSLLAFLLLPFWKISLPAKNGKQTPFHMDTTTSKHQKNYPHLVVYITREKPTKTQGLLSKNQGIWMSQEVLVKGSWVITPRYSHL